MNSDLKYVSNDSYDDIKHLYRVGYVLKVADMKNSVADRSNAQSSCAAQFVGNHIEVRVKYTSFSYYSIEYNI